MAAISAMPEINVPMRPNVSRMAPAKTRTSVAVTVKTLAMIPTVNESAPSCAAYIGMPRLTIWKPKNSARLMVASTTKSRVKISCVCRSAIRSLLV